MKRMKKLTILLGCFLIMLCLMGTKTNIGYAMNENETHAETQAVELNPKEVLYDQALSFFRTTKLFVEEDTNEYNDEFAGAFLDDNGILNIGVVANDANIKSLRTKSNFDGQVEYKKFTYSYNYLQEVKDSIVSCMDDYGVYKVETRESLNQIFGQWDGGIDTSFSQSFSV